MKRILFFGFLIAAAMIILFPFVPSFPDGLEKVADENGFAVVLPAADAKPADDPVRKIAAGMLGAAVCFGAAWGIGRALRRGKRK